MPLYEYLCAQCGRRTEVLQRLDEPPLEICPHCQGTLTKLFSAPAFHFKGSGWYATDYARQSGGASSESEKTESPATAGAEPSGSTPGASAEKAAESGAPAKPGPGPSSSTD